MTEDALTTMYPFARTRAYERRRKLHTLDGACCWLCARARMPWTDMEVCQVVPRRMGGGEGIANLRLACPDCAAARPPVTDADLDEMLRDVPKDVIYRLFRKDQGFITHGRCWRLMNATTGDQNTRMTDQRPVFSRQARVLRELFRPHATRTGDRLCEVPGCGAYGGYAVHVMGLRFAWGSWRLTLCGTHADTGIRGALVDASACIAVLEARAALYADAHRSEIWIGQALGALAFVEEVRSRLGLPDPNERAAAVVPSETCAQQR